MFPYIRCFDKYAGHSWASGDANFADGNNQESSSESLNAWYGMMLWGEATGDKTVRDTGLSLFNTERTAVEEYWFDVSDTNFPKEFPAGRARHDLGRQGRLRHLVLRRHRLHPRHQLAAIHPRLDLHGPPSRLCEKELRPHRPEAQGRRRLQQRLGRSRRHVRRAQRSRLRRRLHRRESRLQARRRQHPRLHVSLDPHSQHARHQRRQRHRGPSVHQCLHERRRQKPTPPTTSARRHR